MGYSFGARSRARLETCHYDLQRVARTAIEYRDFSILEGFRDEETQNRYFREGRSQIQWPNGKHNRKPSRAFDILPYPFKEEDWDDRELWIGFSHFIIGVAAGLGIKLRWGGDWDRDWDLRDNRFNDWPHFELVED